MHVSMSVGSIIQEVGSIDSTSRLRVASGSRIVDYQSILYFSSTGSMSSAKAKMHDDLEAGIAKDADLPTSITTTAPLEAEDDSTLFVDYIAPPPASLPPPSKYKLWLIIMFLVFFAEWFASEARVTDAFERSGYLSPIAAFFFTLAIIVFVLVFATLDLAVTLLTVEVNGRSYGLVPWLKQPRHKWIHKQENIVAECISIVIFILEDGFSLFDAPSVATTAEKPYLPDNEPQEFSCPDSNCRVTLKIEHRINPNKLKEYNLWTHKIDKASAKYARGLIDNRKSAVLSIADTFDEERGESNQVTDGTTTSRSDGLLHIVYLTFESVDRLNDWMSSSRRRRLIEELKPLLAEPDVVQIQKSRMLPDAFTDLLVRQGDCVPNLQPKKWKVFWLTLLGLFFTTMWIGAVLPYYFDVWKLHRAHQRLQGFVSVAFSTFLNSYVMTPLLLFLFDNWIRRKENEIYTREPWRTLSDGITHIWIKALISIMMYGGFVIAWIVNN